MTGKEPGQTGVREVKRGGQRKLSPVRREGVEVQGDVQVGGGADGRRRGKFQYHWGEVFHILPQLPPLPITSNTSRTVGTWRAPKRQSVSQSGRGSW